MVDQLAALDRLLEAEARMNDTRNTDVSPRSKTKQYVGALRDLGLAEANVPAREWRRKFHSTRLLINNLIAGKGDDEVVAYFQARRPEYKGLMARAQTDNLMPPWNMVRTTVLNTETGEPEDVSSPFLLFHILDGRPDITAPYVKKTSRRGPHMTNSAQVNATNVRSTKRNRASTATHFRKQLKTRGTNRGARGNGLSVSEVEKRNQVFCPHMDMSRGWYARTGTRHTLCYKGYSYSFKTCCPACAGQIRKKKGKYVVPSRKGVRTLQLRHKTTGQVVQYAKRTGGSCRDKRTRRSRS